MNMAARQTPAAARPRGWFISVEGIDGAGKSSHIEAIAQALQAQGQRVCLTREPGGTPLGEQLRHLLLHQDMDAWAETLLAFAARRQHLREVIAPALAEGVCVVCDRYTDATYAYQGSGHGVPWQAIAQLERWVQSGWLAVGAGAATAVGDWPEGALLEPDCTLWFDVPPEVAAQRLQQARTPDRFEGQARAFFERVAQGYARRAAQAPARIVRIDAHAPLPQVQERVLAALAQQGILRA